MGYLFVIVAAYVIGSSNMALYLSKLYHIDIRKDGSKNLGASNATMLLGWKAGIAVAVHDIGKSALVVVVAKILFPDLENIGAVAGVASVLGHIYPFYLGFKGGKGLASFIGITIALNWKFALVVMVLLVLVTLITDYIVLGTATTIVVVPIYMGFATQSVLPPLIILIATAVIAYKHRENFVRIWKGTEIRFRAAGRGDYRVNK